MTDKADNKRGLIKTDYLRKRTPLQIPVAILSWEIFVVKVFRDNPTAIINHIVIQKSDSVTFIYNTLKRTLEKYS